MCESYDIQVRESLEISCPLKLSQHSPPNKIVITSHTNLPGTEFQKWGEGCYFTKISKGKPCSFTLSFLKEIDSVKESYFLTGLVERKVNKREIWCIDISRGLVIFPLLYILSLKNVDISLAIIISDFSVSKFQ